MDYFRNIRIARILVVLWFSLSLILAHAMGIHLHVEHTDHLSADVGHVVDVHTASAQHSHHTIEHASEFSNHHNDSASDIKSDSIIKNSTSSHLLMMFVLFSWLLLIPVRQFLYRSVQIVPLLLPFTYLLQPPLRAPPAH